MAKTPTGVRKRGNYWAYYFDKVSINGKRQTETKSGFKSPQEAANARAEAIAAYNNGGFVPLNNSISFVDFSKVFIKYLIENRYSPLSVKSYQDVLNACLLKELGQYKLTSINRSIVNQLVNKLHSEGKTKTTIEHYLIVGKRMFDIAKQHKITTDNPFNDITAPDNSLVNKGRPHKAYTDEYVNQLLSAYKGDKLEPVIMIGNYCGLRISELCALTWNDIDFQNKIINVNKQMVHDEKKRVFYFKTPKWNSVRRVEMPQVLCDYLAELKQVTANNQRYKLTQDQTISEGDDFSFVITNCSGKIVCKRFIIKRVKISSEMGYPHFTVHDLRHTHCTYLIDHHVDNRYVQKRLGHKSLKTTLDIYTHLTEERRKTEADKLDDIY